MVLAVVLVLFSCSGSGSDGTPPSNAKAITAFSIVSPAATGTIDEGAKTIAVTVPFETVITGLVATFVTTGANVTVGGTIQESGTTPNNFSNSVDYLVTAADGTTATYTVTVTVASISAKAITAFSFTSPAATGVIDENAKTIAVTVPFGTDVTTLLATFATTGANVTVGGTIQESGTTPNNFLNSVDYLVTAADGTSATYTVTVSEASGSEKTITSFSFTSPAAIVVIDEAAKTIAVSVPFETDVTALIATFTTTGAGVTVGSIAQVSGTTPNDFTSPVAYTVTAADGTSVSYVVTVTVRTVNVTHLAGTLGGAGSLDNTGAAARFSNPSGITGDGTNLYVADTYNHTIRKIVIATGEVTTLAGTAGMSGSLDNTGAAARFYRPYGITSDGTNLYVADTENHTIRKIVIATAPSLVSPLL